MAKKFASQVLESRSQLIADGVEQACPHHAEDIEIFAKQLSGLGHLSPSDWQSRLKSVEVPRDFYHARFYNLSLTPRDGSQFYPWGGTYSAALDQITLKQLVATIMAVSSVYKGRCTPSGPGVWSETVALPIRHLGTLELGLIFLPFN